MLRFFGLILLTIALPAVAQSSLPPCPVDLKAYWHNCFGTAPYADGAIYIGEFKDNKRDGHGSYTFPTGAKYVGEFKDHQPNGQGTFNFSNGERYVGELKNGVRSGQGTTIFPDGKKYVGEFKDNQPNGRGSSTLANGSKYVGEFRDGLANGQGISYNADGTINQSGLWTNGRLTLSQAVDASLFPFNAPPQTAALPVVPILQQSFTVKSRLPPCPSQRNVAWNNCYGETTIGSGGGYAGEFLNNQYHGRGVFTFPDGMRYVGEFRGHRGDGQGTIFRVDGSVSKSGRFIDGDLVESFAVDITALLEREATVSQNTAQSALPTCKRKGNTRDCYGTFEKADLCWRETDRTYGMNWTYSGKMIFDGCQRVTGVVKEVCPSNGLIKYSDGTVFDGEISSSDSMLGIMCVLKGKGSIKYPDGRSFTGSVNGLQGNIRPIQGVLKSLDKSSCDCVWDELGNIFKPREPIRGKYTLANGDVYEGPFREGKYHGAGSYTFKSGIKYIGAFEQGAFHGKGDLLNPDGSVKSSDVWINGRLRSEVIAETQKWCRGTPRLSLESLEDFSRNFRVHPNSVSLNRVTIDPEKGSCRATIYSTKGAHQCTVLIDKATNTVFMNTRDYFGGLCY